MTPANRRIEDEAAAWVARLRAGALRAHDEAELDRWLAANERHRGAFLRARAGSANIDRLATLAGQGKWAEPAARLTPSRPMRLGMAASIAMVLIGALVGALAWWQWPAGTRYATAVGGVENILLRDGSHVTLNTDTRIRVVLAEKERRVELEQGEAWFEVAKDASRPFIVHAGPVSVRAVGTAFLVRTAGDQIDVTVTEGTVELTDQGVPGAPLVRRVVANESATVVQRRQIEVRSITADVAERQLAWRERMLEFSGETLAVAVQEINRHNEVSIVVDDPSLAQHPIVGNFRADEPENFAATVAAAIGARSIRQGDAIHLRPRTGSAASASGL